MRMKTNKVVRATALFIQRFLEVRLPMDVGTGFRTR